MKIGIIGSGIAGLSAAWLLHQTHDVTLFDRQTELGMDVFSVDVEHAGKTVRLDVPMRLSYGGYYRNLLGMYEQAGIETTHIQATGTFATVDGTAYAQLRSWKVGSLNLPRFTGKAFQNASVSRLIRDGARYAFSAPRELRNGQISRSESFQDYFDQRGYSAGFSNGIMMPMYAVMCTCSYDAIRAYPAEVIIDNLKTHMFFTGFQHIRRVTLGTREVVTRLSKNFQDVRLGTSIQRVCRTDDGVTVTEENGNEHHFDHVVIATQANHVQKFLADMTPAEKIMLDSFTYEPCEVVIHTDESLMPRNRSTWSAINFMVDDSHQYPYATGWMNAMHSDLTPQDDPIFHTLNPMVDIDPQKEVARTQFERSIVTQESLTALNTLNTLHNDPQRRVWFAGSYAAYGIPLQESAVKSSVNVAKRLGVNIPWEN